MYEKKLYKNYGMCLHVCRQCFLNQVFKDCCLFQKIQTAITFIAMISHFITYILQVICVFVL